MTIECTLAALSTLAGYPLAPGDRALVNTALCEQVTDAEIALVKQCAVSFRVTWRFYGPPKPGSAECVNPPAQLNRPRRR